MAMHVDKSTSSRSRIRMLVRDLGAVVASYSKQAAPQDLSRQLLKVQESGLFDATWYLEKNPDVAEAGINPLLHYVRYGGFEGRNPNPSFSSRAYLAAHAELVSMGINPLYHFVVNRTAILAPQKGKSTQTSEKAKAAPIPQTVKAAPTPQTVKAPPPPPVPLVPALPWKGIVEHSQEADRMSRVLGVAHPRGEAARHFELIRVDQDIQVDRLSPAAGYLFDALASESCFGWEGTMTAANNLANEALVRHLRAMRAAKLPTVLVYDATTLSRPFYKDLQSLFTVHVDRRLLEGDEVLPGPFAALCKKAA